MLRAVGGLFLGFAFVFLAVFWVRACLPNPNEEEIDWLHREDIIVIQMRTEGGLCPSFCSFRPPEFTLYGDGTLIFSLRSEDSLKVMQTMLDDDEVKQALEDFEESGFFDFDYTQPSNVEDAPTTYIYAKTSRAANAVSAAGLRTTSNAEGNLRDIRRLADQLAAIQEKHQDEAVPLVPTEGTLDVRAITSTQPIGATQWPFAQINIGSSDPSGVVHHVSLTSGEVASLHLSDVASTHTWDFVEQNGAVFNVQYRPVLPYEENFPEFEPPTP